MQKSTILFSLLLIAGVTAAPAPEPLILQIVSGFANLVLTTASTAINGFGVLVGGAVTALSNIATGLINVASNLILTCIQIKLNIIQNVANFFINTLAVINDTIVAPLLKSAQTIFNALAADVNTAIDQFQGNVSAILTNFSSQLNVTAANATNFVTGLITNLTTVLGNVGYCYDTYSPAVQGFAENFLPYVASCVQESSLNVSNIANNATIVANKTETLVNYLVGNLTSCVSPVLASPNLFAAKLTALSCLNTAITGAATSKIAIISNIVGAKIQLDKDIAAALVQVGQCFGSRVYESAVGAKLINDIIVDCLNSPRE